MRTICLVPVVALLAVCGPAEAAQRVVTVCGASNGKTVTPGAGRAPEWVDDGIQGGTLTFNQDGQSQYDVVIKDALATFSARDDGASIQADEGPKGALTLVVSYPLELLKFTCLP